MKGLLVGERCLRALREAPLSPIRALPALGQELIGDRVGAVQQAPQEEGHGQGGREGGIQGLVEWAQH